MSTPILAVATLVAFAYLSFRLWWLGHLVRRLEARLRAYELVLRIPEIDIASGKLPPPAAARHPGAAPPLGTAPPPAGDDWREEVARAARAGRRVEAVILYRKHTGAGLAEAVEEVKRLRAAD